MEKLNDYDDLKDYRFQCDCTSPEDAMDINVQESINNSKYLIITMNYYPKSFWEKVKLAWEVLVGRGWNWREFTVRPEDQKNLSDLFNPDKKYSELP